MITIFIFNNQFCFLIYLIAMKIGSQYILRLKIQFTEFFMASLERLDRSQLIWQNAAALYPKLQPFVDLTPEERTGKLTQMILAGHKGLTDLRP